MIQIDFAGKVVFVTGGTKGVGKGICEKFLEAGATVIACARNAPEALPQHGGKSVIFRALDVRDSDAINEYFAWIEKEHGRLDVLINNAGGAPMAEAATASPRFHEKIIQLNLTAPLHIAQAANRLMQKQEAGSAIINIASVSAARPSPGTAAYGAAKAGLVNLSRSLAVEWAPKVRVNAIIAGLIVTEQAHLHYGDDAGIAAVGRTIPLGRMATTEDIANVCLFLASNLSAYISGSAVTADGGGEAPAFLNASNAKE
ncbi:MAG TPA: SDR family oxidoreductase [Spongiibacteraceae bacterium]|nr:SDR family oxidoreductase [Spongiibacteraceae bacterium]